MTMNHTYDPDPSRWDDRFEEHVMSGILELLILKVLSERDCLGYELYREVGERTEGTFGKRSAFYAALYRLQDRELILFEAQSANQQTNIRYQILDEGRAYLESAMQRLEHILEVLPVFFRQEESPET